MKEITRIHLAKTAFSVEIDAKKSLEKYLNSIQKNMHADAEAMKEIEARMVEIFAAFIYLALILDVQALLDISASRAWRDERGCY